MKKPVKKPKKLFKRPFGTLYFRALHDTLPGTQGACVTEAGALKAAMTRVTFANRPSMVAQLWGENAHACPKCKITDRRSGIVVYTICNEGEDFEAVPHFGDYEPRKVGLRKVRG